MKKITLLSSLIIFMMLPSVIMAGELMIEPYVQARINVLTAQANHLQHSITIMNNTDLSEAEKFEKIGQPAFTAVDVAAKASGMTLKQLYRFESDHQTAIKTWLDDNEGYAWHLEDLEFQIDNLRAQYDQLITKITRD